MAMVLVKYPSKILGCLFVIAPEHRVAGHQMAYIPMSRILRPGSVNSCPAICIHTICRHFSRHHATVFLETFLKVAPHQPEPVL